MGENDTDEVQPKKRGRGRPVSRWLTLDEVAEIVRGDAEVIARLLEKVPNALPGASNATGVWQVPEKALRALLGASTGPLPALATVGEVAECLRRKPVTVYGWLKMKDGKNKPLLPHREVLGTILIEAAAVLALPTRMPGPPPSFFAPKQGGNAA